jgi:hypothetical protein
MELTGGQRSDMIPHSILQTSRKGLDFIKREKMDQLDFIMAYESGEATEKEIIEGFQHLIDNGMAWKLQGHYGRTAQHLIDEGFCTA